jgi:hypothetical protein
MEETMKSELKTRYYSGETIKAEDFIKGLEFFGTTVFSDWKNEKATAQYGLDQELYWKKTTPVIELSPAKEHLLRPVEKQCINKTFPCQQELDYQKLQEIRQELSTL